MKVIILAGGLGTRISEETSNKPKPMVLINNKPILWHIMSIFAKQGYRNFLIATGFKSEVIEKWVRGVNDSWDIEILNTGLDTQTGGRILECMKYLSGERVFVTYGDGLGNVDLRALVDFHTHQGKLATITAVRPPARFGVLRSKNGLVTEFGEKLQADAGWINGGFFILEPEVKNFISNSSEPFETDALPKLVKAKQLASYHHDGFWYPMDTMREKQELEIISRMDIPSWLSGIN
jgi:glucose-1-phosphate cytidylyltransferase